MVAFNRDLEYEVETKTDDQEWSDNFDFAHHLRDIVFWAGLSFCIGVFVGMAVCSW